MTENKTYAEKALKNGYMKQFSSMEALTDFELNIKHEAEKMLQVIKESSETEAVLPLQLFATDLRLQPDKGTDRRKAVHIIKSALEEETKKEGLQLLFAGSREYAGEGYIQCYVIPRSKNFFFHRVFGLLCNPWSMGLAALLSLFGVIESPTPLVFVPIILYWLGVILPSYMYFDRIEENSVFYQDVMK